MSIHGSASITYSSTNEKGCMHTDAACNKKRTFAYAGYFFPASGEAGVKKSDTRFYLSASPASSEDRPYQRRRNLRRVADCLAFSSAFKRFKRGREGSQRLGMQPWIWSERASFARHVKPHNECGLAHVGVQR